MDAAVAGLVGAGIGAGSSVFIAWIQAVYSARRERSRFIMEFAAADHAKAVSRAAASGRGYTIMPLSIYAHYHSRLYTMIEKNKVSESALTKLSLEIDSLWKEVRSPEDSRWSN